jgi:SAM-dependent methyltransferase
VAANPYDEVPYPSGAFPQTHPDRLATIATLFGMSPPALENCRVLELGAAAGGNLLPMALALPGSTFLGIDSSAVEVAEGRRLLRTAGIGNLELREQDILTFEPEPGGFDYVICHGLYSWVPDAVKDRILAVCRRALSPQGVAYVSYNTYPGNYFRRLLRDTLAWRTQAAASPRERVAEARALAAWLAAAAPATNPIYRTILEGETVRLGKLSDEVLLHDDLAASNEPCYFREFMTHAARHRLQFLGEAHFADMHGPPVAAEVREKLEREGDIVAREQMRDVLACRAFRQTLLCHDGVGLDRRLDPAAIARFHVLANVARVHSAADLLSPEADRFTNPAGITMGLVDPLHKAALRELVAAAPAALGLDDLAARSAASLAAAAGRAGCDAPRRAADRDSLAELLLEAFRGDVVELHLHTPPVTAQPSERPEAARAARFQAMHGRRLTNLWHRNIDLDEPFALALFCQLDGHHDRAQLVLRLADLALAGAFALAADGDAHAQIRHRLELALTKMARLALLQA